MRGKIQIPGRGGVTRYDHGVRIEAVDVHVVEVALVVGEAAELGKNAAEGPSLHAAKTTSNNSSPVDACSATGKKTRNKDRPHAKSNERYIINTTSKPLVQWKRMG